MFLLLKVFKDKKTTNFKKIHNKNFFIQNSKIKSSKNCKKQLKSGKWKMEKKNLLILNLFQQNVNHFVCMFILTLFLILKYYNINKMIYSLNYLI